MPHRWRFAPHDRTVVGRIVDDLRCSPLLAQILASRGVANGDQARVFLDAKMTDLHSPSLLPGADEAADRIVAALRSNRRITIYGDYDVDGVTATSILWHCLKLAGGLVDYYIPSRLEEGYGLNCEAIRKLHEEDPTRLVVTVDCGICSLEEAALAKSLGLELIITDHHTMLETLPEAAALVHPRLPGSEYPFPELCGAGVSFKVAWAVCQRLGDGQRATPAMREYLKSAVSLAAIGTVADVVPLVGENRILVKFGLEILRRYIAGTKIEQPIPGLEMLIKVAGLHEHKELSSEDIAFSLAPRINAAGRLGQARLAVELLTTQNRPRAAQLADYLNQLNKDRQTVERKMFKQAREMVDEHPEWPDHPALILAHPEWHAGVIGVLASRMVEQYRRPAIMIALNEAEQRGQGSGRSYGGFDLHGGLTNCAEHLIGYGGHKFAAGLRVSADRIDAFRDSFIQQMLAGQTTSTDDHEVGVDAEVVLADLTNPALKDLERLGPYGSENRKPILSAAGCELVEPPKKMGGGERHLSLRVKQYGKVLRAIAFGKADWADEMANASGPISICFTAGFNRYKGYESVELQLIDWKPEGAATPVVATT
jgi:single-stranded-DNA-specific exonuclease